MSAGEAARPCGSVGPTSDTALASREANHELTFALDQSLRLIIGLKLKGSESR
jgi:hypothetical protein